MNSVKSFHRYAGFCVRIIRKRIGGTDVHEKKIACLHAHHSNIEYIEKAFSPFDMEWLHFVDSGLMHRVASDETFTFSDASKK